MLICIFFILYFFLYNYISQNIIEGNSAKKQKEESDAALKDGTARVNTGVS